MKKKYKITILLIGIFFTISLMIGLSYAYYIFSVSQSGTNVVRSDCFEITFDDGNAINLNNAIPLTDLEARKLTPYTFNIKNICNTTMKYNVNIETLNNSTIDLNAVATKLDGKKKQILGTLDNNENIVNNNASSSKTIYTSILKAGEERTHNLRLWIDENATNAQSVNKIYSSKVVINTTLNNYSELVDGDIFNATLKRIAGNELTQAMIDQFNESKEQTIEECSNLSDEEYSYHNCAENLAYYNDINNAYVIAIDNKIKNIEFIHSLPENINELETVKLSTNESKKEITGWFIDDTIYIYSEDETIYAKETYAMFYEMTSLTSLDLSTLDTSNAIDMSLMFFEDSSLTNLNLSNLDTSNIVDMNHMFYGVSNLTSLDVSNFDTSNTVDMNHMFYGVSKLTSLDVSNFDTSKVTDMSLMFKSMTNLTSLNVSSFNTSNVTNMSNMFNGLPNLISLDLSNFNTSNVTNMDAMFKDASTLTTLDLSSFDTSKVTNMANMFNGLTNLTSLNVSSFNTSKLTTMWSMFAHMSSLTELDLSNFDTSNVGYMYATFIGMQNLTSLNISSFNTSNVINMSGMFWGDSKLTNINVSNFDTSKVTNMSYMFCGVSSVTSLDISNFNTSSVTIMGGMFRDSFNLKTIFVGNNWNISNLTNDDSSNDYNCGSKNMFYGLGRIIGGAGTTYDANHTDKAYARVDDPTNGNPGYLTLKTT